MINLSPKEKLNLYREYKGYYSTSQYSPERKSTTPYKPQVPLYRPQCELYKPRAPLYHPQYESRKPVCEVHISKGA